MKKTKAKPSNPSSPVRWTSRAKDMPATQGMLQLVRTELKADIRGLRSEMNSRFDQMDSKFAQIDSKFAQMNSRFEQMDSRFEQVLSEVARIGTLVEEQNSRNQIVLEGLTGLFYRQERLEIRMDETEKTVRSLTARSRS